MFANAILKVAFVTTLVGVAVGTALYETHPPFRNWVDEQFSEFQKQAVRADGDSDDDSDDEKTREARSWELNHRTGKYPFQDDDTLGKENYAEKECPKDSLSLSSARSAVPAGYATGADHRETVGIARLRGASAFNSGSAFANPFSDESAVLFDRDSDTVHSGSSQHSREASPARDSQFATPDSSHRSGSARRLSASSGRSNSTTSTVSHLPRTVASSQADTEDGTSVAESLRQNPLMAVLNGSNEDIFVEQVSETESDAGADTGANTAQWVRRQDELSDWDAQSQASGYSESAASGDYDFLSSADEDAGAATPGPLPSGNQSTRPASPAGESTASGSTGFDVLSGASTPRSASLSAESRLRARERLRLLRKQQQREEGDVTDTASNQSWDALSGEDGVGAGL